MNTPTVSLSSQEGVGILAIYNPPVNALSPHTVHGLVEALAAFEARPDLRALVVHCAGRTFVAGGDINAFDDPGFSPEPYNDFLERLEAQQRPVVAALHGTALGGGLELALACHGRVAALRTRFGLPEIKLGLIPGSLGTQRLPRLVGARRALQMMSGGDMVDTDAALAMGLVDEVATEDLLASAIARALRLADAAGPPRRTRELRVGPGSLPADLLAEVRTRALRPPELPALGALADCVEAAATLGFETGRAVEARHFLACLRSPSSRALRHLFLAERKAARVPGLPAADTLPAMREVGVVGAGTMGGGIAMSLVQAGCTVRLLDNSDAALERCLQRIRGLYDSARAKGRLEPQEMERRLALLRPGTDDAALGSCDLVIEAVHEDMALKLEVAARLGRVCRPDAIIATNTSTLDVDRIAAASGRPGQVLGLHFFSPAHVMRLLEVVRGRHTEPAVLARALALARRLGKVGVVSANAWGFIGNRMVEVYMRETEFLLLEGATPAQVDGAVESLGMAMGPCRMLDMAGIDVGARTVIERAREGALPDDAGYRVVCRALFERGQHGQKTGAGYYRYAGRAPEPHPLTLELCADLARQLGIRRRDGIGPEEIRSRLLHALVNEGARVLEEGVAGRGGDIDVVWAAGFGFPGTLGGPMHWADACGLPAVVEALRHWGAVRGNAHGYWTVSPLLERLAREGGRLAGHTAWNP
jgi:3-hydroxyacyl-CoA dehydrogenase